MRRSWLLRGLGFALVGGSIIVSMGFGPPKPAPPPTRTPTPAPKPVAPALGDAFAGLKPSEMARFEAGFQQFLEVEDLAGGLGPVFTEDSCVTCHSAGATGGAGVRVVTRIGQLINGQYDPMVAFGGPLIQNQGIGLVNGVNFVGEVVPPQATIVAHRRTTPLFGLGLVDAVPDVAFHMIAQQEMALSPTTAGQISVVNEPAAGSHVVGRFGWKAQHANLFGFAGDAYGNEIGVTTPFQPAENCPQGNCALLAANPAATNPNDLNNDSIQALTDFVTFLAPPPRAPSAQRSKPARPSFARIGCADLPSPFPANRPERLRRGSAW